MNAGSFVTLNDRVTARSKRIPSINRHAIPPRLKRARFVLFLAWCEKPSSARDRVKSETKLNTKRRENGVAEQERKVGKRKRCGVTFFSPLSPLSSTLSSTLKVSPTSHSYSPIRIYMYIYSFVSPSVFSVAIHKIIARSSFKFYFFRQYLSTFYTYMYMYTR